MPPFLFLSLSQSENSPRWSLGSITLGRRLAALGCRFGAWISGASASRGFTLVHWFPERFAIAFTALVYSRSIAAGVTVSTFVVKKVGVPVFLFLIAYLRCEISWTRLFNPLNILRISFIALLWSKAMGKIYRCWV
ncbi:TPA: hypothetical protein P2I01_000398 [Aeromonas salmonicida]|nr:hypothetical protein [Aeromonas salmonicida]